MEAAGPGIPQVLRRRRRSWAMQHDREHSGLLRERVRKSTDLSLHASADLGRIELELNRRTCTVLATAARRVAQRPTDLAEPGIVAMLARGGAGYRWPPRDRRCTRRDELTTDNPPTGSGATTPAHGEPAWVGSLPRGRPSRTRRPRPRERIGRSGSWRRGRGFPGRGPGAADSHPRNKLGRV